MHHIKHLLGIHFQVVNYFTSQRTSTYNYFNIKLKALIGLPCCLAKLSQCNLGQAYLSVKPCPSITGNTFSVPVFSPHHQHFAHNHLAGDRRGEHRSGCLTPPNYDPRPANKCCQLVQFNIYRIYEAFPFKISNPVKIPIRP